MENESDLREALLETIEGYLGKMDNLHLLSTQELIQIAQALKLEY